MTDLLTRPVREGSGGRGGRGEGAGKPKNSKVKLRWVVVVVGGGMRGFL